MGTKRNKRNRSIKIEADVFYQPKKALGIGTEFTGKFTRPETNYQKKRVTIETSSFGFPVYNGFFSVLYLLNYPVTPYSVYILVGPRDKVKAVILFAGERN